MTETILAIAVKAVGAIIVFAGAVKAVAPYDFSVHLSSLNLIPAKMNQAAVTAVAGVEVAWGTALLLGLAPSATLPLSAASLFILSLISWRGVATGMTEDCGCYGGFIKLSIGQSLSLNALFIAVLLSAWFSGLRGGDLPLLPAAVTVAAGAAAYLLALAGMSHEAKHGAPLFDVSPLKVGNKWNHAWAAGATEEMSGEFFVSYLGANCPCCKLWVRVANAMTHSPHLPKVIGVMAATPARTAEFVNDFSVNFAIAHISNSMMARMTRAVPTTAIIRDGVIRELFTGTLPPEHSERFARAFFPAPVSQPEPTRTRQPA